MAQIYKCFRLQIPVGISVNNRAAILARLILEGLFFIIIIFSSTLEPFYNPDDDYLICPTENNNGEVTCGVGFDPYFSNFTGCARHYVASNFSLTNITSTTCVDWNTFYTSCKPVAENPNYGAISFDNSGQAFIAIFQVS